MLDVLAPALGAVVTVYGLVAGASSLLQARQMVRRGTSGDLSLSFLGLYAGGYGLWLLYGLSIDSLPLVVVDAVGLLCGAITLALAVRLRRRAPSADGQRVDLAQLPPGGAVRASRGVKVLDALVAVPVRRTAPSRWRVVTRIGQEAKRNRGRSRRRPRLAAVARPPERAVSMAQIEICRVKVRSHARPVRRHPSRSKPDLKQDPGDVSLNKKEAWQWEG